ncbi:hypothetical protein Droror1_Dr00021361 [Drosera rotundifolia]
MVERRAPPPHLQSFRSPVSMPPRSLSIQILGMGHAPAAYCIISLGSFKINPASLATLRLQECRRSIGLSPASAHTSLPEQQNSLDEKCMNFILFLFYFGK